MNKQRKIIIEHKKSNFPSFHPKISQRQNINKIGRNDPCPCGKVDKLGKPVKFKKCCLGTSNEEEITRPFNIDSKKIMTMPEESLNALIDDLENDIYTIKEDKNEN